MLNYSDVQNLRQKGISNFDILKIISRTNPSAAKAVAEINADRGMDQITRESRIGSMLDKSTPRNTPSALGYANALAFNAQKKTYDSVQTVKNEEDTFSLGDAVLNAGKGIAGFAISPLAVAAAPILSVYNQLDKLSNRLTGKERTPEEEAQIKAGLDESWRTAGANVPAAAMMVTGMGGKTAGFGIKALSSRLATVGGTATFGQSLASGESLPVATGRGLTTALTAKIGLSSGAKVAVGSLIAATAVNKGLSNENVFSKKAAQDYLSSFLMGYVPMKLPEMMRTQGKNLEVAGFSKFGKYIQKLGGGIRPPGQQKLPSPLSRTEEIPPGKESAWNVSAYPKRMKSVLSKLLIVVQKKLVRSALDLPRGVESKILQNTMAGIMPEDWLISKGLIGTRKELVQPLTYIAENSKILVNESLEIIPGRYPNESSIKLLHLIAKELPILNRETLGGYSEQVKLVNELMEQSQFGGELTISQHNQIKLLADEFTPMFSRATGSPSQTAVGEALRDYRENVRQFIENKAAEYDMPYIRELNRNIQVSRTLLKEFAKAPPQSGITWGRATNYLGRAAISGGLGSLIGLKFNSVGWAGGMVGGVMLERLAETPAVQIYIARSLKILPESEQTKIANMLESGKLNADAATTLNTVIHDSLNEIIHIMDLDPSQYRYYFPEMLDPKLAQPVIDIMKKIKEDIMTTPSANPEAVSQVIPSTPATPQKLYHGSNKKIDTFEVPKTGGRWLGDGVYFTDNRQRAGMFGKEITEVEVNMKNPYVAGQPFNEKLKSSLRKLFNSPSEKKILNRIISTNEPLNSTDINPSLITKLYKDADYDGVIARNGDVLVFDESIIITTPSASPKAQVLPQSSSPIQQTSSPTLPLPTQKVKKIPEEAMQKGFEELGGMKIEKASDVTGKEQSIIRISKNKGEKLFSSIGFEQQQNKNFWKKGDVYTHYNTIDKTWHIEGTLPDHK